MASTEKAARLVADDRLPDEEIAEECGITRNTLVGWKEEPRFAARVKAISDAYADRAQERAEDAELANVPGGKTGIVTKTLKGIGKGEDFRVVEVYEVDIRTLKEFAPCSSRSRRNLVSGSNVRQRSISTSIRQDDSKFFFSGSGHRRRYSRKQRKSRASRAQNSTNPQTSS